MSAKTISSDITPKVNRKGNRLYDIFAMKVAFSSFYFVFRVFLLTFDLQLFNQFCRNFPKIFQNPNFIKYPTTLYESH